MPESRRCSTSGAMPTTHSANCASVEPGGGEKRGAEEDADGKRTREGAEDAVLDGSG